VSSPSVTAFREWYRRYGNFEPTKTEDACFQAGVEWALGVTGQASRQGSDLRGRVIVLFRPLTAQELERETGPHEPVDLAAIDEEIKRTTAEKEDAVSRQDFECAASLRNHADQLRVKRRGQINQDLLQNWPCLELDDGTLIYGAKQGTPFVGYKPSSPEGQQKVGFGFQTALATVQVTAGPEAT